MSNQNSETRNPIFLCLIAVIIGIALLIWGGIKIDCNGGPGCWIGSGFLLWAGGILTVGGIAGWFIFGNRK